MFDKYPDIDDKITKTVGLMYPLELNDQLIDTTMDSNLSIINPEEEKVATDYLKECLKKHHMARNSGISYVRYTHNGLSRSRLSFDALESFEDLALSIRILTGRKCECLLYASCNEQVSPAYYYNVFDFLEGKDLYLFPEEKSIVFNDEDIKSLKRIYQKIVSNSPFRGSQEYSRLKNALDFFNKSYDTQWFLLKVTLLFTVLESIFSEDSYEISYKISLRTAYFLYRDQQDLRKKTFEFLRLGYNMRSEFVHGGKVDTIKKEKKLASIRGVDHYSIMFDYPNDLYELVRKVLYGIILDEDVFKMVSEKNKEDSYKVFLDNIALDTKDPLKS
jgi:hypothetical protein